jgi:hypothetical protein
LEAESEFLLFGLGEGLYPGGEGLSLKEVQRDHKTAAGSAASLARDGLACLAKFGTDACDH